MNDILSFISSLAKNDVFIVSSGLCSIIGLLIALFVVNKVIKIEKQINIIDNSKNAEQKNKHGDNKLTMN